MKDIKKFAKSVNAVFVLTLLVSAFWTLAPQKVLAAGCTTSPASDAQIQQQKECIKKYKNECKNTYRAEFCNSLTVAQINDCAANGSDSKLKKACMDLLADAYEKATGSAATDNKLSDPTNSQDCKASSFAKLNADNCGIIEALIVITNVLSGIVGLVIVSMLIWGGIQYASAGPDPSKVQAAKQKIINAITALLLFIFGYALLQWLVPGGIF